MGNNFEESKPVSKSRSFGDIRCHFYFQFYLDNDFKIAKFETSYIKETRK